VDIVVDNADERMLEELTMVSILGTPVERSGIVSRADCSRWQRELVKIACDMRLAQVRNKAATSEIIPGCIYEESG
jgi:hypothetical protein